MSARCLLGLASLLAACDGAGTDAGVDATAADAADAGACESTPAVTCDCASVMPGNDGRIAPSRPIRGLIADPIRCRVYGWSDDAIVVLDTREKRELVVVPIANGVRDLDISSDGSVLAAASGTSGLAILDPREPTAVRVVPTTADVERLQADRGRVFYVTLDQTSALYRFDLASGADTLLRRTLCYECPIVLADDGRSLLAATSRASPPSVERFGVAEDGFGLLDASGPLAVEPSSDRWAVLSSDEDRLYFARAIVDAADLGHVLGLTEERVLLEDSERGLAIGTAHVYSVATGQAVRTLPQPITSATLTGDGAELWAIEASGEVRYSAADDLRP